MAELPYEEPGQRRWVMSLPSGGKFDLLIDGAEPDDLEFVREWLTLINKHMHRVLRERPPAVEPPHAG